MVRSDDIDRFWSHVNFDSECWIWTASKYRNGYGQFAIRGESRTPAHRTAYKIVNGDIPDGLCVLHRCDNPACVRPSHLFLGTHSDNTRDAMKKNRLRCGEKSPRAVLNNKKVRFIRNAFIKGKTQNELAKQFSVSQTAISKITRSIRWKHLGLDPIPSHGRQATGERCHSSKLTEVQVNRIRRCSMYGIRNAELAKRFGVSSVLIGLIVRQKIWKRV